MSKYIALITYILAIALLVTMNILLRRSKRIVQQSRNIIETQISNNRRLFENCKTANYIESLNLFGEKIFTTTEGDTISIDSILNYPQNIVLWLGKNFCQTCIFETLNHLNTNLTTSQKECFSVFMQKNNSQGIEYAYLSHKTYFCYTDLSVFEENISVEAILFMVDYNHKINLCIVVDSTQMELITYTIQLMRSVIGNKMTNENS